MFLGMTLRTPRADEGYKITYEDLKKEPEELFSAVGSMSYVYRVPEGYF